MKLSRNPVVAALTVATLLLAGCGTANQLVNPAAKQAGMVQAQKAKKKKADAGARANKDWKIVDGVVTKLLPDDMNGSKHQHFLFKTAEGKTIKIAHNIDLAEYVPVKVGDEVTVKCEYIKASPYDVAHWTHYDPRGGEGGYIEHNGKTYDRL